MEKEKGMNIKEIKELMEAVSQNGITELEVERAGVKVRIRKDNQPSQSTTSPSVSTVAPDSSSFVSAVATENGSGAVPILTESVVENKENLFIVRSPIVGTFYRAPNPTADAFIRIGDSVEPGRVLCIIEAMKLMNEIESEIGGEIANIYVENGEPVEFGQALFGIRPTQ